MGEQQPADRRRRRAEGHEDQREAADEREDAAEEPGSGPGERRQRQGAEVGRAVRRWRTDGTVGPRCTENPAQRGERGCAHRHHLGNRRAGGGATARWRPQRVELGRGQARDHREVRGNEREDAGREEGEHPGAEGHQDAEGVGVDGGRAQHEHAPHLRRTLSPSGWRRGPDRPRPSSARARGSRPRAASSVSRGPSWACPPAGRPRPAAGNVRR